MFSNCAHICQLMDLFLMLSSYLPVEFRPISTNVRKDPPCHVCILCECNHEIKKYKRMVFNWRNYITAHCNGLGFLFNKNVFSHIWCWEILTQHRDRLGPYVVRWCRLTFNEVWGQLLVYGWDVNETFTELLTTYSRISATNCRCISVQNP